MCLRFLDLLSPKPTFPNPPIPAIRRQVGCNGGLRPNSGRQTVLWAALLVGQFVVT